MNDQTSIPPDTTLECKILLKFLWVGARGEP